MKLNLCKARLPLKALPEKKDENKFVQRLERILTNLSKVLTYLRYQFATKTKFVKILQSLDEEICFEQHNFKYDVLEFELFFLNSTKLNVNRFLINQGELFCQKES